MVLYFSESYPYMQTNSNFGCITNFKITNNPTIDINYT